MNADNIGALMKYLKRLPGEIEAATIIDATRRPKENISDTHTFIEWANKNHGVII
jgi:hypothetical protein